MARASKYRKYRMLAASTAVDALFSSLGGARTRQLLGLWNNWAFAVGDDVAELGLPLGHKDAVLVIGVDDSMALQELSMQAPDILERVNAFMDEPFFSHIRLVLRQGQRVLTEKRPVRPTHVEVKMPSAPARLGGLLGKLSPDSPVARCYEAYVRAFAESTDTQK